MEVRNERERRKRDMEFAIQEYLALPLEERCIGKICDKWHLRRCTMGDELKKRGYFLANYKKIPHVDETVFDTIDTEEKAYWLGFLYADGCVSYKRNTIYLQLNREDRAHLEKFASFIKLSNKIHDIEENKNGKIYPGSKIEFNSSKIKNALISVGCVPKKSLILKFPKLEWFASKDLIRHFIRGYVDGDGCLGNYTYGNRHCSHLSILGTYNFLYGIKYFFNNRGTIIKHDERKVFNYQARGAEARWIARVLYEGATIYLDRKYNKYLEFCRFEEGSSSNRIISSKIGEYCDVNTEVPIEIAQGTIAPQSVEGE